MSPVNLPRLYFISLSTLLFLVSFSVVSVYSAQEEKAASLSDRASRLIKVQRAFKEKVKAAVADENKRPVLERIYQRINEVNSVATDEDLYFLGRFEVILGKVDERAAALSKKGLDVSAVTNAAAAARAEVALVKDLAEAQAAKVYEFVLAENRLQENVGLTVSEMRHDLAELLDKAKGAHQLVKEAVLVLRAIK